MAFRPLFKASILICLQILEEADRQHADPLHQERGEKHCKPGHARPGQACQRLGRACQERSY